MALKNPTKPENEFDFTIFQPNSPKNKELFALFENHIYQKLRSSLRIF